MWGQDSVFQLLHRVNWSVSVNAWLGMIEPPWKSFGAVEIVPDWVAYIKAEQVGMEYGWEMGGAVEFKGRIWYSPNDGICNRNCGNETVDYLHQSPVQAI